MKKKAENVYFDTNSTMLKSTLGVDVQNYVKKYVKGKALTRKMRLVDVERNSCRGNTYWFEDETGVRYPMSDTVFINYIKKHPKKFGIKEFEFLQQGHVYSINFIGGRDY